jgi:hypothetical protein
MPINFKNSNKKEVKQSKKIIAYLEGKEKVLKIPYGTLLSMFSESFETDSPILNFAIRLSSIERIREGEYSFQPGEKLFSFSIEVNESDKLKAKKEIEEWGLNFNFDIKDLYLEKDPLSLIELIKI